MIDAIVTMPPYAPFVSEVLRHKAVSGIRLNTVMPISGKDRLEDVLKRLGDESAKSGKDLWIDLKCRQLRIKNYGVPPFTEIELTHRISVETPTRAYFGNGEDYATVLEVSDGNRLIMQEGPKRIVGPGESVNIPDRSLSVEGYFTDTDKRYIEAACNAGMHNYILSFVEKESDIMDLCSLDDKARIIAKIESKKGMDYVKNAYDGSFRLMAARGDLYIELDKPHEISEAVETIIRRNPAAVAASRIFTSLSRSLEPSCADIGDVDNLMRMGYRSIMFGDDICMRRESIISGLNLLYAMKERYE